MRAGALIVSFATLGWAAEAAMAQPGNTPPGQTLPTTGPTQPPPPPPPQAPDPYGQPAPGPYGQPAPGPYGQPAPGPYGQPAPGPYGQPPGPYGQPVGQMQPPPSQYHPRRGRITAGLRFGLGTYSITVDGSECFECSAVAIAGSGHLGWAVSDRFALILDGELGLMRLEGDSFSSSDLVESSIALVGQYWFRPRLWGKFGAGPSSISAVYNDDSGVSDSEHIADGGRLLLGAGYELRSSARMSIDLEARFSAGIYDDAQADVSLVTVGLSANWH